MLFFFLPYEYYMLFTIPEPMAGIEPATYSFIYASISLTSLYEDETVS